MYGSESLNIFSWFDGSQRRAMVRRSSDQGINVNKIAIDQLSENAVSQSIEYLETADLEALRKKRRTN